MGFVRLACLIHAANVRSEPGSNPSINCLNCLGETGRLRGTARPRIPVQEFDCRLGINHKELFRSSLRCHEHRMWSAKGVPHPRVGFLSLPSCQRANEITTVTELDAPPPQEGSAHRYREGRWNLSQPKVGRRVV
jgi:hypothetical protein